MSNIFLNEFIESETNEYLLISKTSRRNDTLSQDQKGFTSKRSLSSMTSTYEPPKNAIYIILGEIQTLTSSKKNNNRWANNSNYEETTEINAFQKLKTTLNSISDIRDIDSLTFLSPFLDIIRSDETSGPITCLALNSVNKFLSYGLIDNQSETSSGTIDKVANAVTHTRFVGTNPNDDEVVLMRILQVLRSLLLSPIGAKMTNENVCEILQACFRICFETRLSELLRKTSENVLVDMIQLLFARLPQFKDEKSSTITEQLADSSSSTTTENKSSSNDDDDDDDERPTAIDSATHAIPPTDDTTATNLRSNENESSPNQLDLSSSTTSTTTTTTTTTITTPNEYINSTGIRFTTSSTDGSIKESLKPHGWPCVRDLLHFLTTLINHYDKNNTEAMMTVGLNLLTVALEVGGDYLSSHPPILNIVQDVLCRNLISMFHSTRLNLFSASLRVSFLLFESLRTHLKYQFEFFMTRLMELIVSEQTKVTIDQKEIALETIIQLLRIPGLPAELYLNYDSDLYSTNLFEDLTKMLSKNAFPVAGLTAIHILSLDALLSVIDHIELECQSQVQRQKHEALGQSLTRPISSGYALALSLQNIQMNSSSTLSYETRLRQNRMSSSINLPTHDHLKKLKQKKQLLRKGCESFNQKPSSGLEFLQDNGLLSKPLNMSEVAEFLRNNPLLDKKVIGDFISNRKNNEVLEEYVKSFHFENMRIDEALRIYLSEFRLPGEAPLIFNLLEHFAARWRICNNNQLANNDAAFGLAYACIMLNTDQHNANIRRQMPRMQCEDFIKNLSNMNNQENFDETMLRDIFRAIRSEEIVMPAEHTGLVRESYLWKSMIKRSMTSNEPFLHAPTGSYNYDIFTLIWGQTMAALSFVFEKSNYDLVIEKSIQGFSKCARIAAYYSMSDVFDNLVISLCKFTTLLNSREGIHRDFTWTETLPIQFGLNRKARLAATVVFNLAHVHGDILRDGWRNILECVIHLYKAKLLPSSLVEVEDLLDPSGRTSLIKEQTPQAPKTDTGLFSQLAYFLGGGGSTDSNTNPDKQTTAEEQEAIKQATSCIEQCHLDQLFQETKFLLIDSLNELIKALIYTCQISPDAQKLDQDVAVFSLEMLVRVVLQNRDRVTTFWSTIRNQFYAILVNANEKSFFVERTCVGLLRIAARLLRREELVSEVLDSLRILLLMKPNVLQTLASEIAFGLHELLRTDAANIHQSNDWFILFSLLEVVGACAPAPPVFQSAPTQFLNKSITQSQSITNVDSDSECSDCVTNTTTSDKGYTSDSEIYRRPDYVVVSHDDLKTMRNQQTNFKTELKENSIRHDRRALIKCCEILSFLICDVAYVTGDNFEYCIHCIRTFIEVTIAQHHFINNSKGTTNQRKTNIRRVTSSNTLNTDYLTEQSNSQRGSTRNEYSDDDDGQESIRQEYQALALQLLELLYTLHTRASQVFKHLPVDQNRSSILWYKCWCPIFQGIARLCCDPRRLIRSSAFNYLQRSVLLPELHSLPPTEWESMFTKVLFPLLLQLIDTKTTSESQFGFEEIRVRVSQLLCRIFLQHLTPLLTLPTFTGLWLTILDFMDKYSKTDQTDTLRESVSESLKNMLLVMNTTNLFDLNEQLTILTKERIHSFLPGLWDEVFKVATPPSPPPSTTTTTTTATQSTVPINLEEKPSAPPVEEPSQPEPIVPINEKSSSETMDE